MCLWVVAVWSPIYAPHVVAIRSAVGAMTTASVTCSSGARFALATVLRKRALRGFGVRLSSSVSSASPQTDAAKTAAWAMSIAPQALRAAMGAAPPERSIAGCVRPVVTTGTAPTACAFRDAMDAPCVRRRVVLRTPARMAPPAARSWGPSSAPACHALVGAPWASARQGVAAEPLRTARAVCA